MSNENNIPRRKPKATKASDGKLPMHDLDDAYVDVPDRPEMITPDKKKFKDTAFGRTILLKNKTGKTIAGVLTGALAVFTGVDLSPILTPITGGTEMDFLFDAGLIEIIITGVTFLLVAGVSWLGAYFKLPKAIKRKFVDFVEIASDELEKAIHVESEKGRQVTKRELMVGLKNTIYRVFKIDVDKIKDELSEK